VLAAEVLGREPQRASVPPAKFSTSTSKCGAAAEDRPPFVLPEVERDAALVAIERLEEHRHAVDRRIASLALVAALRRLDLDDVGAHVGEHRRANGPAKSREVEHGRGRALISEGSSPSRRGASGRRIQRARGRASRASRRCAEIAVVGGEELLDCFSSGCVCSFVSVGSPRARSKPLPLDELREHLVVGPVSLTPLFNCRFQSKPRLSASASASESCRRLGTDETGSCARTSSGVSSQSFLPASIALVRPRSFSARRALPGICEVGIERDRLLVGLHGVLELGLGDEIDGLVEEIPLVGHAASVSIRPPAGKVVSTVRVDSQEPGS
jgi:hypothetical protein